MRGTPSAIIQPAARLITIWMPMKRSFHGSTWRLKDLSRQLSLLTAAFVNALGWLRLVSGVAWSTTTPFAHRHRDLSARRERY